MKNKGFTLVELLAVIAILAILVIVAMPNVLGMFNQAKMNSFVTEVQQIMDTATVTFTRDALLNSGKTVYYSSTENTTLRTKKLDMSGNEKQYFIEMNRNGEFKRVVVYDANYCYDIYASDSNGNYDGSKSKLINDKISKTTVLVNDVWESGNDSVEITFDGDKYIVTGCTGILAGEDTSAPTCKLKATASGVTFEIKTDNVGVTSYGLVKSTTQTFNSEDTLELSNGKFYGYVKDEAGNTGSCSITISGTTQTSNYSKTTRTCSYGITNYTNIIKRCDRSLENYTQTMRQCKSDIMNYTAIMRTCIMQPRYKQFARTCLNNGGTYAFGPDVLLEGEATSCTNSSFTCNESNVGRQYISCQNAPIYSFTSSPETKSSCSVEGSFTCNSSNVGRRYISQCITNNNTYWKDITSTVSSCTTTSSFSCKYPFRDRTYIASCTPNYNYRWTTASYTASYCPSTSGFTCDSSNVGRSYASSCTPNYQYNWRNTTASVSSCTVDTSFECNSSNNGRSYVASCIRETVCASGYTKINNTYCYKY